MFEIIWLVINKIRLTASQTLQNNERKRLNHSLLAGAVHGLQEQQLPTPLICTHDSAERNIIKDHKTVH